MQLISVLILAALTLGICYLADKAFGRTFRSNPLHRSGLSVKVNQRYAAAGIILLALGAASIVNWLATNWLMVAAGILLLILGSGLVVYYLSFGIYYDDNQFLYSRFGKKSVTYRYNQIRAQQLYNASGNIVVELHMTDGSTVPLQAMMPGVYPFLDAAFAGWCRQKGIPAEECPFYDPQNTCYFPPVEEL